MSRSKQIDDLLQSLGIAREQPVRTADEPGPPAAPVATQSPVEPDPIAPQQLAPDAPSQVEPADPSPPDPQPASPVLRQAEPAALREVKPAALREVDATAARQVELAVPRQLQPPAQQQAEPAVPRQPEPVSHHESAPQHLEPATPAPNAPAAPQLLDAPVPQQAETAAPEPRVVTPGPVSAQPRERAAAPVSSFFPSAPESLDEAGLTDSDVGALVLKYLYFRRSDTGFKMSRHLGLRLAVIEPLLRNLKQDRMVVYKGTATGGDYIYELTDLGMDRAAGLVGQCSYFGTAPVPLDQYIKAVSAQSLTHLQPTLQRIGQAFDDMTMSDELVSRVGQAIHSGRGMFLYGNAGNGKTSMAERITRAFGDNIWIPRTLSLSGEIVRLFDPNKHQEVEVDSTAANAADGRWVKVVRPTIMAGGELRMENLEIAYIRGSGIGEAPLQLKANCGTLLIDDFGRQKMSVDELLNRWIVPLEQRRDFIYLESGRTVEVPFDELIVFSTNLEPRDLVDEAFLRRIPYKIEVGDPSDDQFRGLFLSLAGDMQLECKPALVEYLIETHFHGAGRGMRFCHPRDVLRQIENFCTLHKEPRVVTKANIDRAVLNYFSIM